MARETKVIQAHPDRENDVISRYEVFGWEVIGNQRCQEEKREGDTIYTSTFNKITFSREKSSPWYERVCALEEEADGLIEYGYEELKDAYGYNERTGLGDRPEPYVTPAFARPGKFAFALIVFIIGLVFCCINLLEISENLAFLYLGGFIALIGFISVLSNIKSLKGLKGEEKEKAIKKWYERKEQIQQYDIEIKKFVRKRLAEIEAEATELINGKI